MCMTTRERERERERRERSATERCIHRERERRGFWLVCVSLGFTRIPIARVGAGCVNGAADLELRTATVCA